MLGGLGIPSCVRLTGAPKSFKALGFGAFELQGFGGLRFEGGSCPKDRFDGATCIAGSRVIGVIYQVSI